MSYMYCNTWKLGDFYLLIALISFFSICRPERIVSFDKFIYVLAFDRERTVTEVNRSLYSNILNAVQT